MKYGRTLLHANLLGPSVYGALNKDKNEQDSTFLSYGCWRHSYLSKILAARRDLLYAKTPYIIRTDQLLWTNLKTLLCPKGSVQTEQKVMVDILLCMLIVYLLASVLICQCSDRIFALTLCLDTSSMPVSCPGCSNSCAYADKTCDHCTTPAIHITGRALVARDMKRNQVL